MRRYFDGGIGRLGDAFAMARRVNPYKIALNVVPAQHLGSYGAEFVFTRYR